MILSVSDLVKLQAPASRGAARASELLPIHGPTTTTAAARDRAWPTATGGLWAARGGATQQNLQLQLATEYYAVWLELSAAASDT